jgi:DNA processing protein
MSDHAAELQARALLLLFCLLPGWRGEKPEPPLGYREWSELGPRLRAAGIASYEDLLTAGPEFWAASGLEPETLARLRRLLERGPALEVELARLQGLGIRTVTRGSPLYPARLLERLGAKAPPLLFGAGNWALLCRAGLAISGSRVVDTGGEAFSRAVAARCARDGLLVVTGGARGVDRMAMDAALSAGGAVVGVMPGDLERTLKGADVRGWLEEESLLLLSPYHPRVGFTAGNAMARNKLIYSLADYGLVVSTAHGQGGTWAGARELLRHGWVPLFVRDDPAAPEGNRELLRPAARPFPTLEALGEEPLPVWLERHAARTAPTADLFSLVWPSLAAFLTAPRAVAEVAAEFRLHPEQAEAWLARAEAEGQVRCTGDSFTLYIVAARSRSA